METSKPGIYALGNTTDIYMFKHTANYQADIVSDNLLRGKSSDEISVSHFLIRTLAVAHETCRRIIDPREDQPSEEPIAQSPDCADNDARWTPPVSRIHRSDRRLHRVSPIKVRSRNSQEKI
ncbi:MAG TPA: hypothetical protein VK436_12470 [Methanocella sp.]|nr:hypothetical protein [Methanocella sp.]